MSSTNRKRAARKLARETGVTYMQALEQILTSEAAPQAVMACVTCGHEDAHTGGGLGVCLAADCGCDGPVSGEPNQAFLARKREMKARALVRSFLPQFVTLQVVRDTDVLSFTVEFPEFDLADSEVGFDFTDEVEATVADLLVEAGLPVEFEDIVIDGEEYDDALQVLLGDAIQQAVKVDPELMLGEEQELDYDPAEMGECDHCGVLYELGSRVDHCAECGNCWSHCTCGLQAISFDDMIKVEWYDAGEGLSGDYDPEDPEDVALLRYDAYVRWDSDERVNERRGLERSYGDDMWGVPQDSSYCTQVPVGTDPAVLRQLAQVIANELADALDNGGWKHRAEEMSWAHPEWITGKK